MIEWSVVAQTKPNFMSRQEELKEIKIQLSQTKNPVKSLKLYQRAFDLFKVKLYQRAFDLFKELNQTFAAEKCKNAIIQLEKKLENHASNDEENNIRIKENNEENNIRMKENNTRGNSSNTGGQTGGNNTASGGHTSTGLAGKQTSIMIWTTKEASINTVRKPTTLLSDSLKKKSRPQKPMGKNLDQLLIKLPPELLFMITSQLSIMDIYRLSLTCVDMVQLFQGNHLYWSTFDWGSRAVKFTNENLEALYKMTKGNVKDFKLVGAKKITASCLVKIAKSNHPMTKVESFQLNAMSSKISGSSISWLLKATTLGKTLKRVSLAGLPALDDQNVAYLFERLVSVTHWDLSACPALSDNCLLNQKKVIHVDLLLRLVLNRLYLFIQCLFNSTT